MKVVVNKANFIGAISNVRKIIPSKTTIQSLCGIRIKTENDSIELVGTDMVTNVRCWCEAKVEEPGEVIIPGEKLFAMASGMCGENITLSTMNDDSRILVTDAKSKYKIGGFSPETYVPVYFGKELEVCTVGSGQLRDAISQTEFAAEDNVSTAGGRALAGIYCDFDGEKIKFVATDRKKIAVCSVSIENSNGQPSQFFLPIKSAALVKGFCKSGNCVISRFAKMVTFKFDNLEFNTSLLNNAFPNYQGIIDAVGGIDNQLKISATEFGGILKRATIVETGNDNGVFLGLSQGHMVVSCDSREFGSYEEEMLCAYEGSEIKVGLEPSGTIEMLSRFVTSDVIARFKDDSSPMKFECGNVIVVAMPVK